MMKSFSKKKESAENDSSRNVLAKAHKPTHDLVIVQKEK
jgi:hypothetical protein